LCGLDCQWLTNTRVYIAPSFFISFIRMSILPVIPCYTVLFVCQTLFASHVSQYCNVLKSRECGLLIIAVPHSSHLLKANNVMLITLSRQRWERNSFSFVQ
jgi:hypothetical protein